MGKVQLFLYLNKEYSYLKEDIENIGDKKIKKSLDRRDIDGLLDILCHEKEL